MVFGLPLDCCATPSVPTWQSGVVDGEPGLQLAPSQGQHVTDPPHPRASDSGGITVTITIHFWIWRPSGTASRPRLRPRIKDETREKWVSDPQRNLIVNLWASYTSFPTCRCNQCLKTHMLGWWGAFDSAGAKWNGFETWSSEKTYNILQLTSGFRSFENSPITRATNLTRGSEDMDDLRSTLDSRM